MTVFDFPRPKGVRNPNRDASSLLLAQVDHLHEAEKSLPPGYHSGIFHKTIRTEGQAARYIRAVTEAIHRAHDDAARELARPVPKRKRVIEIAAVADESAERKRRTSSRGKNKKKRGKRGRNS